MKIKKAEFSESEILFKKIEEARSIDLSKEIQVIETKILELDKLYQREKTLRHNSSAHAYQQQMNLLFSQIEALRSEKHQRTETAIADFDKYHKPFKKQFNERLIFIYGKVEQEFVFFVMDSTEAMFARVHKIQTNAISILESLKNVSLEINFIKDACLPLSELNARLEDFEKALIFSFPEKIYSVTGDLELLQLKGFFTNPDDYTDSEFRPLIYSPEVFENKIRLIQAVLK